jgi:uncharacterized protein (TIGR03086 family)
MTVPSVPSVPPTSSMAPSPADVIAGTFTGGFALLERAMGYTLGSLALVTPELMAGPTPCAAWSLRALLLHMNDSLQTLHEAIDSGRLDLEARPAAAADYGDPVADPVGTLRTRACRMIGAWADARGPTRISIADSGLPAGLVAATGAVEVAVHGWDVARSCGAFRPLPPSLAADLLPLVRLVVDDADRPHRFAAPPDVRPNGTASDHLLAHLGRRTG